MCQERWPFSAIDRHKNWKRCYAARNNVQRGWEGGRAGDFEVTTFRGHTNYITCFQFYRANLVSGSADNTLRVLFSFCFCVTTQVWRANNPEVSQPLLGHTGIVNCLQFNEVMAMSGSHDSTCKVWDAATGATLNTFHHGRLRNIQFSIHPL